VGGAISRRLETAGINVLPLGRHEIDLLDENAGEELARRLHSDDTLVLVSAKAPCKDLAMLMENMRMAMSVSAALQAKSVAHLIYISSDAVYKDSSQPLTEFSCAQPAAIHGAMHLTREVALQQVYSGPFAIVRPTLVYGYDDPHNGYGPNRFRRLAAEGRELVLFGEGEERRDHVDVEDIAELVRLMVLHRTAGIANAVSGEVVSFRALAEHAAAAFAPAVVVRGSPRSGPMPHNGYRAFDNSGVLKAFPGFRFKGWREGLDAVHLRQHKEKQA
jgi:UDP-glucose 4-epimerase